MTDTLYRWVKASERLWEYGKETIIRHDGIVRTVKYHNVIESRGADKVQWLEPLPSQKSDMEQAAHEYAIGMVDEQGGTFNHYQDGFLAGAGYSKGGEEKLAAWNLAITIANNECMRMSDDWNNDDQTEEAHAANECAKRIRGYIDSPIPELGSTPSRPSLDIDKVVEELRESNPWKVELGKEFGSQGKGWNECVVYLKELLNQSK